MELIAAPELPPHLATKAQKLAANRQVRAAIKRGELVRPQVCPRCGIAWTTGCVNAHHEDYAAPLSVVWLCGACHIERHREIRRSVITPRVCVICQQVFRVPDGRKKLCGRLSCVWELQRRNAAMHNQRRREERFHRVSATWLVAHR